jgi:hypothetical protein
MRALPLILLSAVALTSIPASASVRSSTAHVTTVSASCPTLEGYPDCHPSGRSGWTLYSGYAR